jgi:hypothetical protein
LVSTTSIEVHRMSEDSGRISFLNKQLGPEFRRRVVAIGAGRSQDYIAVDWHDAIVVVENGQIELEHLDGSRECFHEGAILPLAKLPLRRLHNPGSELVVLVAVSRRRPTGQD